MRGSLMTAGVCRLRGRDACISRISRISRISQIYGCVTIYPEGLLCRSLEWLGRRCAARVMQLADLPQGYARHLDGCGGVRVAWVWHNKNGNERKRTETNGEKGVPRDTPGFVVPQFGMARVKIYRLGDYCNRRTNHPIS